MSAFFPSSSAKAGALVGFLAMAIVGWKAAEPAKQAVIDSGPAEPAATKGLQRHERSAPHGPPEYVRERLRAIRSTASSAERMRATLDLVNSLPVADLAAWIDGRWFDVGEGFDATLFKKIALRRWMEEDPEGHAAWCMKTGADSEVFDSWAKDDPQRVLAFFLKYPNREMELNALQSVSRDHPDLALARLKEIVSQRFDTQATDSYDVRLVLEAIGFRNPAALESAMDSLPLKWRNEAERILISLRLKSDFSGEIRKLWERPDGFSILLNGTESDVAGKLLGELKNLPASWKASFAENYSNFIAPDNAEQWFNADLDGNGFTPELIQKIKLAAVESIAYRKPELAIQQMASLNLSEQERKHLIGNVFSRSEAREPGKAESLLAMLGSEEDRQIARGLLAAPPADPLADPFADPPKIERTSDWLEKAAAYDLNGGLPYQLFSALNQWDQSKISELTGAFNSLPEDQKKKIAGVLAFGSDAYNNIDPTLSGTAIRYLMDHPPEQADPDSECHPIELASRHAVFWSQQDPAAASAWVQSLPAGDAKLWAQKNLAANWSQYDPDAAGQWVKSLPADARGAVEKFMKDPSSN